MRAKSSMELQVCHQNPAGIQTCTKANHCFIGNLEHTIDTKLSMWPGQGGSFQAV